MDFASLLSTLMDPQNLAKYSAFVVALASILNIFISSNSPAGKVINALALGFKKAAPDPAKQK